MKKLTTILLILMLSSFFVMTSYSVAIPTQPNMTKEFALSTDWASSDESITSFSETSADDTLLYPDGLLTEPLFATGGDTGYGNTYVVDGSYFVVVTDNELEFDDYLDGLGYIVADEVNGYFEYNIYAVLQLPGDTCEVYYSDDGVSWSAAFEDLDSTGYHTGTVVISSLSYETFYLKFETAMNIDYVDLQFFVDPIPNQNVPLLETFCDVSDWTITQGTITTDNDVAKIERTTGSYAYAVFDFETDKELTNCYIESYISDGIEDYQFQLRGDGGTPTLYSSGWLSGTGTFKAIIPNGTDVNEVWVFVDDTEAPGSEWVEFDYLRIGKSNYMGWQHDGSTIYSVTSTTDADFTFTNSTDGDILTLGIEQIGADTGTERFYIDYDPTSTESNINADYYPFFKMHYRVTEFNGLSSVALRIYVDGGNYESFNLNTSGSWTTLYCNVEAFTSNDPANYAHFRIYSAFDQIGDKFEIDIDYAKAYSIANFTYDDGGSESTNDYAYTDNGKLVYHTDTYTKLNYDPTLAVTIATYDLWNATIEGSAGGFRFRELLDTNTLYDQGDTNGSLVGTTLTDFALLIYSNCNITAIEFIYQLPEWNTAVGEADFILSISYDYWGLNMIIIFGGLVTMIFSTCMMAVKVRDRNISRDAGILLLFLFCVGWGLFVGGAVIG